MSATREARRGVRRVFPALPVLACLLLWEFVSRSGFVSTLLVPAPTSVLVALEEWTASGDLMADLWSSGARVTLGFALGGASGVLAGMATGRSRKFDAMLSPIFQSLRPLPPVAIIPLIIVWLGIGNLAKVFSIAFAVFFPTWINTHLGASAVPETYIWTARLLRPSGAGAFFRVLVPAAMPSIIAGLRTSLALAFVMVYVSELAGASRGLGYRISVAHLAYRIDLMMAALAVLGALGALSDFVFTRAVHRAFPWLGVP